MLTPQIALETNVGGMRNAFCALLPLLPQGREKKMRKFKTARILLGNAIRVTSWANTYIFSSQQANMTISRHTSRATEAMHQERSST